MNYINILKKEDCCGCNACVQICPVSCIDMKIDEKGFWYPSVNEDKCINCGKCINVCQIYNKKYKDIIKLENIQIYGVKHKNSNTRNMSSSGGMFTAISNYIINNNGVVFGATYDNEFKVIQTSARNYNKRNAMRGSKYVQSYVGNTFIEVKELLNKGTLVLYTGTPCQISGLYNYLCSNYDNLITCDLVCHGVPSPEIFKKYIKFIQKNVNDDIKNINFRYKDKNFFDNFLIEFQKKSYSNLLYCDPYGRLFLDDIILRPSCYECKYMNTDRIGDITIGDFWGVDNVIPDFYDEKGISLIFINTKKGEFLFNKIKNEIIVRQSKLEDCKPYNAFNKNIKPLYSEEFWNDYIQGEEFSSLLVKYAIKNIISNKSFINIAINKYAIVDEENCNFLNMIHRWIKWCDRTFIKASIKNKTLLCKYQQDKEEILNYGAFYIANYYANK